MAYSTFPPIPILCLTLSFTAPGLLSGQVLSSTVAKPELAAGQTSTITIRLGEEAADLTKYSVTISAPPEGIAALRFEARTSGELAFQAPMSLGNVRWHDFDVTITDKSDSSRKLELKVRVHPNREMDWEARAIVGWHQAGASSAKSEQNLFIDFFVARPLGGGAVYDAPVNLWGQVRIASSPQQRAIPISQFAINFAAQLGEVKVNEIAQSGEFLTGIETRIPFLGRWLTTRWDGAERIRTLGFVAFFGANGAFRDPTSEPKVFRALTPSSPQWDNFVKQFDKFADTGYQARVKYLGLVPPDRERFYRQYGAGIRFTSYDRKERSSPPSMFTATVGQDQLITRGHYRGPVFKADAFYPLPMGGTRFLFLFGTANLAISKPENRTPLAMQPIPAACAESAPATDRGVNCDVPLYDDKVAVFAIPSARDTYRVGAGIDIVGLLKRFGL